MRWATLLLFSLSAFSATIRTRPCSGGIEAAKIRVDVRRPSGGATRSLSRIKRVEKGSRVLYRPVEMPQDLKNNAKVTLVAGAPDSGLTILEFRPAAVSAEWSIPVRANLIVFVLGPQGLDEKRVNNLVMRDEELIASLADYADQTVEIEDTVEELTAQSEEEDSDLDPSRLDRNSPTDQALYTLLRALNPTLLANNPMGTGKRIGPVTLMNKATDGFFENAGGLFPGGGALTEIKPMLFPDSDFRAAFVQHTGESLALCVPRTLRSRNRQVYLWARRVIDGDAPSLALTAANRIPIGVRSSVAVRAAKPADWRYLDRVEQWTLTPVSGGDSLPAKVRASSQSRTLDVDLRGFPGPAGKYKLKGEWDWDPVPVSGDLELTPLSDLKQARLGALTEGNGASRLTIEGTNFEFIERVTLRPAGGQPELAQPLQFILPRGRRSGAQSSLEVDVDPRTLRSGQYLLALQQSDGRSQELPVQLASDNVRIENLPIRIDTSTAAQKFTLRGSGLDEITEIQISGAQVTLEPARNSTLRTATVTFQSAQTKGQRVDLSLRTSAAMPLRKIPAALEVAGVRPRITSIKSTLPPDLGVAMKDGELAANNAAAISLRFDSPDRLSAVRLTCGEVPSFTFTGPDSIYFTTVLTTPCDLAVTVESAIGLSSAPSLLGRVVGVPRIESIQFTGDKNGDGSYVATLSGSGLESIEKTGWASGGAIPVDSLPMPAAGQPGKQTLRIGMPWPSPAPKSPLHIWLRGEGEGRATTIRY